MSNQIKLTMSSGVEVVVTKLPEPLNEAGRYDYGYKGPRSTLTVDGVALELTTSDAQSLLWAIEHASGVRSGRG